MRSLGKGGVVAVGWREFSFKTGVLGMGGTGGGFRTNEQWLDCDDGGSHGTGLVSSSWHWDCPGVASALNMSMLTRMPLFVTGAGGITNAGAVTHVRAGGSRGFGAGIHGAIVVG